MFKQLSKSNPPQSKTKVQCPVKDCPKTLLGKKFRKDNIKAHLAACHPNETFKESKNFMNFFKSKGDAEVEIKNRNDKVLYRIIYTSRKFSIYPTSLSKNIILV